MDLLEILKDASSSANTRYTEFLQQYRFDKETIHLFFEGNEDQSFYMNYISDVFSKELTIYTYVCNGKGKVHSIYESINWVTYSKNRVLFFTDKDFSTVLNQTWNTDENIFSTKPYSIENYICNSQMIERILKEILHINNASLVKKFCSHFVDEETDFENLILPLTAVIIMLKRAGNDVPLKDFNLSKIFRLNDELEVKKLHHIKMFDYFEKTTQCIIPRNSWKAILDICKELRRDFQKEDYIRGKFSLWFLVNYSKKIPDRINNLKKTGQSVVKCSVCTQITAENAVEILGPRVPMPIELKLFLNHNAQRLTTGHTQLPGSAGANDSSLGFTSG
jgi:hypothetical protein